MPRRDEFVTVDGFELHYSEWGDPTDPPVVCVHGLSRVGRDFDPLAAALEDEYRVVCPDMPGRGWSEWADEPSERYPNEAMVEMLTGFCETLSLDSIRYVGTSMGGGLGMALAGGPFADRISHLVVNDVSPDPSADADREALDRIFAYVSSPPASNTVSDLEEQFRGLYEGRFSPMTDEEWRRFTVTSARRTGNGEVAPAHDPRIIVDATGDEEEAGDESPDPWDVWEAIESKVLILRGKESQILPETPYRRMQETQPDAETIEVECGHAPALNVPEQIDPIRAFLTE